MGNAEKVAKIIQRNGHDIAAKVVDRVYADNPGVWEKYGEKGYEVSVRDAESHIPYLAESIKTSDATVFSDYSRWKQQLFSSLHLPSDTMEQTLSHLQAVINSYLDNEMKQIVAPVFEKSIIALHQPLVEKKPFISESQPYGQEVKQYFDALIAGDRTAARKVVFDAIEGGASVKDVYMYVFQPSQYEIGRLWQANDISVAKEHFASAATQQIMAQLYPKIFSSERNGKVMVAANVGGDLHEMGIRMVADFFEMEGWDTYYLGANTPLKSVLDTIEEYHPDLVALSATMPFHRTIMKEFVMKVRETAPHLKVMVGGRAVKSGNKELNWFGADGYAKDARQAVEIADKLVK